MGEVRHDLPEVAFEAWGIQNKAKLPWDRDPEFCRVARCGMKIDNILSMAHAREALRQRRLIGTPFAKKFLLDREHIFKKYPKKIMENLDQLRQSNDGKVDVNVQFMKFTFNLISKGCSDHFINFQLNLLTADISREIRFDMVLMKYNLFPRFLGAMFNLYNDVN
jgi:hypothetical protein